MIALDVAIVGGGPAGLAAALELSAAGLKNIKLFERHPRLGGVLPQCIHYGFGLEYFAEDLTGPEFAQRLVRRVDEAGVAYATGAMVTRLAQGVLEVCSAAEGRREYSCRAIILAAGCRERTRENLEVAGSRPTGIFMAGQAQTLMNLHGVLPGKTAVIQGSGDIGLIMARRLALSGMTVLGVFERLPHLCGLMRNKVQCLDHFQIPLFLNNSIRTIRGARRVEAVEVQDQQTGSNREIACDTVLFAAGLIPEIELYLQAGGVAESGLPRMKNGYESEIGGVYLAGNALHINDLADHAAREGEMCARQVAQALHAPVCQAWDGPNLHQTRDTRFTQEYFQQAQREQRKVCIVCPKSCSLEDPVALCTHGRAYRSKGLEGNFQKLTRTRVREGKVVLESTAEVEVNRRGETDFSHKLTIAGSDDPNAP